MDVSVENLAVARGGVAVLEGVELRLSPGQALVLRGPNGAGKTSLLQAMAGLLVPLSGRIAGTEDRVAYAGHADGLKAMLSVAENLTFWAEVFGARGIGPALDAFALRGLGDRLAGTLSAGQKRRLGLARLLVTRRPVWLLDEPTVSLDALAVEMFSAAVRRHLDAGGAALIATHIELGLAGATELDISAFRPRARARLGASDEAFL